MILANKKKQYKYLEWESVYQLNSIAELPWATNTVHEDLKRFIGTAEYNTMTALDIGCGVGQVTKYLNRVGYNAVGIDISNTAINYCKMLWGSQNIGLRFLCRDSIYFVDNNKYDLIVDFHHLSHIQEPDIFQYRASINDLLKNDGRLIVAAFSRDDDCCHGRKFRDSYFVSDEVVHYSSHEMNILFECFQFKRGCSIVVPGKNMIHKVELHEYIK